MSLIAFPAAFTRLENLNELFLSYRRKGAMEKFYKRLREAEQGPVFTIGRFKIAAIVFYWANPAMASVLKYNLTTRANEWRPLGLLGSTTQTRSPVFRSRTDGEDHLDCRFKVGTYSFNYRLQVV